MIDVTELIYLREGEPLFNGAAFRLYNGMIYGVTGTGAEELLAILAGSLGYSGGKVNLNGFDLRTEPARARRGGGYVSADPCFCGTETVRELLREAAAMRGVSERQRARAVEAVLEGVESDDCGNLTVNRLTPLQKRRFWLAQALIGDTDRLLLAEPTLGLEEGDAQAFWDLLREVRGERMLVVATEDERFLAACDAVLLIENGKVTVKATDAPEKTTLSLTVRGERNAVIDALSHVEGIESCRFGIPTDAGDLSLSLISIAADAGELTERIRAELARSGSELLSANADGKEKNL